MRIPDNKQAGSCGGGGKDVVSSTMLNHLGLRREKRKREKKTSLNERHGPDVEIGIWSKLGNHEKRALVRPDASS